MSATSTETQNSSSSAPLHLELPSARELEEAQSERDRASKLATVAAVLPIAGLAIGISVDSGIAGALVGVVVASLIALPVGIASLIRLSQPRHAGRPGRGRSAIAIVVGLALGWLPVLAVWLLLENAHFN